MPQVLNASRVGTRARSDRVYVGRPGKWGNPFVVNVHGSREEVIARYRTYLRNDKRLMASLSELKGKDLVCWCAPLPCHGEILLELANK